MPVLAIGIGISAGLATASRSWFGDGWRNTTWVAKFSMHPWASLSQPLLSAYGDVYALDFNYYAALYQTKRRGLPPRVVTAVAEQMPFKDDAFYLVFSFRLLQHMHEPGERRAIFSEYARVSRK